MFEAAKEYLNGRVAEEHAGVILGALMCLERHGFMSAWVEISNRIEEISDSPTSVVLDDIETILTIGLNVVLANHSIYMEGSTAIKTIVAEGLLVLADYDDSSQIVSMCDADDDSIQTLCDLLEMVTEKTWADFAEVIIKVSPALIKALGDRHRARDEEMDDGMRIVTDPVRLAAIGKHLATYPVTRAKTAITEDGVYIGCPLDILLNAHRPYLNSLQPAAAIQAGIELVGLCLISDMSFTNFNRLVKDQIEAVYSDVNFITQMDISVDEVLRSIVST
jgi:hypothetical protein